MKHWLLAIFFLLTLGALAQKPQGQAKKTPTPKPQKPQIEYKVVDAPYIADVEAPYSFSYAGDIVNIRLFKPCSGTSLNEIIINKSDFVQFDDLVQKARALGAEIEQLPQMWIIRWETLPKQQDINLTFTIKLKQGLKTYPDFYNLSVSYITFQHGSPVFINQKHVYERLISSTGRVEYRLVYQ